jgi:diadenosine tetraphosphate (Ap4A) HIT family hydrolase
MAEPNKILTQEQWFCLEGCRSYRQYHHMRKHFEFGHCTFCDLDTELNDILFEDEHVYAWHVPTQFMRKELVFHWLIVPKRHVRFEADLTQDENSSVLKAKQFMRNRFGYEGGMTHVREGDMRKNAGTVPHLHYNTFVPRGTDEVRIPVFKDLSDQAKNERRTAEFAKRYEAREKP